MNALNVKGKKHSAKRCEIGIKKVRDVSKR